MLKSKIVHLKKIYKFGLDYFLEKRTVFILIEKTLLKIKSCGFRPNNARYELFISKKSTILVLTIFVLIVKNVIKNQKFNFPDKLYDIRNKC